MAVWQELSMAPLRSHFVSKKFLRRTVRPNSPLIMCHEKEFPLFKYSIRYKPNIVFNIIYFPAGFARLYAAAVTFQKRIEDEVCVLVYRVRTGLRIEYLCDIVKVTFIRYTRGAGGLNILNEGVVTLWHYILLNLGIDALHVPACRLVLSPCSG